MHRKKLKVAEIKEGEVLTGKVETIKDYGAFVDLGDGVSGLVHISRFLWIVLSIRLLF